MKPCESHILNHLEYSTTGDKILVCAGNAQPKVRIIKHARGTTQFILKVSKISKPLVKAIEAVELSALYCDAVYYCKTCSEALHGSVNINCSS